MSFIAPGTSTLWRAFSTTNRREKQFERVRRRSSQQCEAERVSYSIGAERRCAALLALQIRQAKNDIRLRERRRRSLRSDDLEPARCRAFWICNQEGGTAT